MKGALLALLLACLPSVAMADIANVSCATFFDSETAPATVKELIEATPGGGARVCTERSFERREHYEAISSVTSGLYGVCRYTIRQMFRETDADQKPHWSDRSHSGTPSDPFLLMAPAAAQGCPRQGDPQYVGVTGVSEGLFLYFVKFWNDLLTPDRMDGLLSTVPAAHRAFEDFQDFEAAIRDPSNRQRFRLWGIRLDRVQFSPTEPRHIYAYDLYVKTRDDSWVLSVDITPDGPLIIGAGRYYE